MNKQKKILILVPARTARGGITNYYYSLQGKFTLPVEYFVRGARTWPVKSNAFAELFRIISDIIRFAFRIFFYKYDLLQTTTSFSRNAIIRDGVFILLARLRGIKVIVFYRGWDYQYADKIINKRLKLFKRVFFKADAMIDLAKHNTGLLKTMGYNKPVFLESTLVDETLLHGFDIDDIKAKYNQPATIRILFLSRIERGKGIYIVLAAFRKIRTKFDNLKLVIAGDGSETEEIRKIIEGEDLKDIELTGFVDGGVKSKIYRECHLYILPTLFTEGMSNALLEAMAFGLPVISRPMGGNADILADQVNGYLTLSEDPEDYTALLQKLVENPATMEQMALNNFRYARDHFYSGVVVKRLEKIFNDVMDKECAE
jgi:glycosyltransferase involved in cell wall biosynthesis